MKQNSIFSYFLCEAE